MRCLRSYQLIPSVVLCLSVVLTLPSIAQTFTTDSVTLSTGRKGLTATTLNDGTVLAAGGATLSDSPYSSIDRILSTSSAGTGAAMYTVREYAAATLLRDGTVLITGGYNGSASVYDAETYDPSTHYFTATANHMARERYGHTSTLLNDGTVLIVGGRDPGGSEIDTVEIYDPQARTFSTLPVALAYARYLHTATLLQNGKVYLAGGADYHSSGIVQSELYDPVARTVSSAGNLVQGRAYHTANLLPNGKVLLAGGTDSSGIYGKAEIYDPAANTSSATGSLAKARYAHTATMLSNGLILVAGGYTSSSAVTASAELFDPLSNTFTPTGSMNAARALHAAVNMPDASVLIIGGANVSSALQSVESYIYPMNTGTINPKFVVVSLAYAPPGSGSNVDYSNSSTLGTNFTFAASTTNGVTTSYTNGGSVPYIGGVSITESSGWSAQVGSSTSFGLSKTVSASDIVQGPASVGLSHDSDQYFLWLNPLFDLSIPNNSSTFVWNNIAYDNRDQYGLDIFAMPGTYLKNPGLQNTGLSSRTSRNWDPSSNGPLNSTDYQTILNRNPFVVNANYNPNVVDPSTNVLRFQSLQNNPINYVPAAPGSQPITHQQTISYTGSQGSGTNAKDTYTTSFNITTMAGSFGPKSAASLTSSSTLELTSSNNFTNQKGQSSMLTIVPPQSSDNYAGTTAFGLYEDNVYGTFMFYPIQTGRPAAYSDVGTTPTTTPAALQSGGGTATVTGNADASPSTGRGRPIGHNSPGQCIWSGFGSAVANGSQTLYMNYDVQGGGQTPGNSFTSIQVSTDGGNTFTTLSNPTAAGQLTYVIPTGVNLGQLQVKATASATYTGSDGVHYTHMPISLMLVQ